MAVERRERHGAVMRPHAPRWPELRPRRGYDEQRHQRATLGKTAEHIECVGSAQCRPSSASTTG
jgi:hypothetical protein